MPSTLPAVLPSNIILEFLNKMSVREGEEFVVRIDGMPEYRMPFDISLDAAMRGLSIHVRKHTQ
jgi:hypothetical protein